MAIELVTGHAGSAHVSSFDEAARMVHVFGDGTTVLGDMPTLLLPDANTVSIPACDMMMQGRFVRLTGTNNVTIESGTQEVYRTDTVMLRYTIDDAGIENCSLFYVRGEDAASASDAEAAGTEYEGLNISDGATIVDVPIIHIALAALTPTASWVIDNKDAIASIQEAVESIPTLVAQLNGCHIYVGQLDKNVGTSNTTEATIWTKNVFESNFNVRSGQYINCCVFFANGNFNAGPLGPVGSECVTSGTYAGWHARWTQNATGGKSFKYLVVVPQSASTI